MVMAKYIGGCLGVNYMTNTFYVSLPCKRRLESGGVAIWLLLVSIWLCVDLCTAKETVLLPFLKTKNEKILLRMLQQTNYHVKYERFINGKLMECISPLKNDLTKSSSARIIPLSASLDFAKTLSLHSNVGYAGLSAGELEETRRVDLILDLVQGICLYYSTFTFVYEYCHKEHVRQFDNSNTKTQNQKPLFEDISMGVWNPNSYVDRPTKLNIKQLTEEEKAARIPEVSIFSMQYRHFSVENNDNHLGSIEFEEGLDGRTLHSNAHITSNNVLLQMPIILTITCEDYSSGKTVNINNYAIMVSSFDLIYTKKNGKCDRYLTFERLHTSAKYFPDQDTQPIRVMGSFIYGHVEERCTRNLEWERPGTERKQHHLKSGSLLLLELYNFKQKALQLHYVTVKHVFSGQLIEIESPIGKSFYREKKQDVQFTDYVTNRLISNVTRCQVLFEQPVNFEAATTGNKYLSSHLMKLNQTHAANLEDARLGCFCKIDQAGNIKVIDMEVKVGSKLWADHYITYIKTNTNIYNPHLFKDLMFADCDDIGCVPFLESPAQTQQIKGKKFTKIIRFNSAHPQQSFTSTSKDQIFAITIRKAGILRLITTDVEGNTFVYLLSEGQIIKIQEFANGTKQIIKQNKYYENATLPDDEFENNIIYLHITILPNGSYMGAIWKYKDYLQFPRFLFYNERMSKFELVAGVADVRILDTGRMRRKDSLAIKQYPRILQRQQFIKKVADPVSEAEKIIKNDITSEKKKESLLLTRSHSINYTYISGQYCGQPINKYRQTIVTIKCGKPWFQITKLLETSPCEYWLQIESSLLCEQNYKTVVERDEDIPDKSVEDEVIFNGLLCLPATGIFDDAYHYLHFSAFDQEDIEVTVGKANEQNERRRVEQRRVEQTVQESSVKRPEEVDASEK